MQNKAFWPLFYKELRPHKSWINGRGVKDLIQFKLTICNLKYLDNVF